MPDVLNGSRYWRWKTSRRGGDRYTPKDIDYFALVVLPLNRVIFIKPGDTGPTHRVRVDRLTRDFEKASLEYILGECDGR